MAEVLQRIARPRRVPGRMLAGIAEVPDIVVPVVAAQVGEQHRSPVQHLQDLHGESAIHVGLGGAHMSLLGALPVVGVVQEGLGDVHGREVGSQLRLALDPREVEVPLVDQLAHGVVGADLAFQQCRGQLPAVVVDAGGVPLQPLPAGAGASGINQLRSADDLQLIDLLHVNPELLHPLRGVGDRRVHAHGPTSDPPKRLTAQPAVGSPRPDPRKHPGDDVRVCDVTPGASVTTAYLVQRPRGRQHPDHARVLG